MFEKITTTNFPKLIEYINDIKTSENPKCRINTHTHTHTPIIKSKIMRKS